MKTISRTIEKTVIEAEAIKFVDGEWVHRELKQVTTGDKKDKVELKVSKYFDSLEAGETLVVKSITTSEKTYEVPVDKFIELAEKLEEVSVDETVIRA